MFRHCTLCVWKWAVVCSIVLETLHSFRFRPANKQPLTRLYDQTRDKQNLLKEEVAELTVGIKEFQTDAFQRLYNKNLRWGSWPTGQKDPRISIAANTTLAVSGSTLKNGLVSVSDSATLNPSAASSNQSRDDSTPAAPPVPGIVRATEGTIPTTGVAQPMLSRAEDAVRLVSAPSPEQRRQPMPIPSKPPLPGSSALSAVAGIIAKVRETLRAQNAASKNAVKTRHISETKAAARPSLPVPAPVITSVAEKSSVAEEETTAPAYARKVTAPKAASLVKSPAKAPNIGNLFAFGGPARSAERTKRAETPTKFSPAESTPSAPTSLPFTASVRKATTTPSRDASASTSGGLLKAIENFIGGAGSPVLEISDGNEYFANRVEEEVVQPTAVAKAPVSKPASARTEPAKSAVDKKSSPAGAGGGFFGFLAKPPGAPASPAASRASTASAVMAVRSQPRVVAATPVASTAKVSVEPARTVGSRSEPPANPVGAFFGMLQGTPKVAANSQPRVVAATPPVTAAKVKVSAAPVRSASLDSSRPPTNPVRSFFGLLQGTSKASSVSPEKVAVNRQPRVVASSPPVTTAKVSVEPARTANSGSSSNPASAFFGMLQRTPRAATVSPLKASVRDKPRVVAANPPVTTAKVSVEPARSTRSSLLANPARGFFGIFQSKSPSPVPPAKTAANSAVPLGPAATTSGKEARAAHSMNAKFRAMVDRVLKGDIAKIGTFQNSTDALRAGDMPTKAYLTAIRQLFGDGLLDTVLTPLIAELPERDVANRLKAEWDTSKRSSSSNAPASGPLGVLSMLGKPAAQSGGGSAAAMRAVSPAIPPAFASRVTAVASPVTTPRLPTAPAPKTAVSPAVTRQATKAPITIDGVTVPDQVPLSRKQYVSVQMQALKSGSVDANNFYSGLVKELGRTKVRVILPTLLEQLPRDKAAKVAAEDAAAGNS